MYLVGIWPRCVRGPYRNKKKMDGRGGRAIGTWENTDNEKSKWDLSESHLIHFQNFHLRIGFCSWTWPNLLNQFSITTLYYYFIITFLSISSPPPPPPTLNILHNFKKEIYYWELQCAKQNKNWVKHWLKDTRYTIYIQLLL